MAVGSFRSWATFRVEGLGSSRHLPFDEGRGRWVLAEVLRRAGELDAAEAEIQTALLLLTTAYPLEVPGALATLAALRLAQGRIAEALTAAEDGMARYETMGACSYFFRGGFLRLVHADVSTRAETTTPPRLPLPKPESGSSSLLARSTIRPIARASSRTSPRTGEPWNSPSNGSAKRCDAGMRCGRGGSASGVRLLAVAQCHAVRWSGRKREHGIRCRGRSPLPRTLV